MQDRDMLNVVLSNEMTGANPNESERKEGKHHRAVLSNIGGISCGLSLGGRADGTARKIEGWYVSWMVGLLNHGVILVEFLCPREVAFDCVTVYIQRRMEVHIK